MSVHHQYLLQRRYPRCQESHPTTPHTRYCSLPGVSSNHTTYTLLPSTEICALREFPVVSLILSGSVKVSPPSVLLAKKISKISSLSGEASCHTTYTLLPSDEI